MIIRLLQRITKSLEKAGIPYMLSGSIALNKDYISYWCKRLNLNTFELL